MVGGLRGPAAAVLAEGRRRRRHRLPPRCVVPRREVSARGPSVAVALTSEPVSEPGTPAAGVGGARRRQSAEPRRGDERPGPSRSRVVDAVVSEGPCVALAVTVAVASAPAGPEGRGTDTGIVEPKERITPDIDGSPVKGVGRVEEV